MYDFDHPLGDRENVGNMKTHTTPEALRRRNITSFAAAEMDFRTAPSVVEAIKRAAERGIYGFTIPTAEYLGAVRWWHREMRGWELEDEWIVPTLGTIFSVAEAIRLTTTERERIIVQTPVYYRYEQAADRQGRETVHNPLKIVDGRYEMDFEDLDRKMADPANKLLVLCNAHNPVGRVWPEADLRRVGELSEKYGVVVFCDEIFGEMTFDGHTAVPYASSRRGGGTPSPSRAWGRPSTSPASTTPTPSSRTRPYGSGSSARSTQTTTAVWAPSSTPPCWGPTARRERSGSRRRGSTSGKTAGLRRST